MKPWPLLFIGSMLCSACTGIDNEEFIKRGLRSKAYICTRVLEPNGGRSYLLEKDEIDDLRSILRHSSEVKTYHGNATATLCKLHVEGYERFFYPTGELFCFAFPPKDRGAFNARMRRIFHRHWITSPTDAIFTEE